MKPFNWPKLCFVFYFVQPAVGNMHVKHKFCSKKFGVLYYEQGRISFLFCWQVTSNETILSTKGMNKICFLAEKPNTADAETTKCSPPRVCFEWRANSIQQSPLEANTSWANMDFCYRVNNSLPRVSILSPWDHSTNSPSNYEYLSSTFVL